MLGRRADGWVLASETAALDILEAQFVRDVEPGEIVVIEADGVRSIRFAEADLKLCVFEAIYFARPDSYMLGRNLYEARRRMGEWLADEARADADVVVPVPDTGAPAAAGFAERSRLPYREGMVKNRYVGTDVHPAIADAAPARSGGSSSTRLREVVRGKRLVVVDDSIVRGTTTRQIVSLLRAAGAAEVHLRISAPPIYHPCFYGIDTQIERELIASHMTVDEVRDFVGADSLSYLSIGGVLSALDLPRDLFCFACFDGQYPVPVPYDVASHKFVLEDEPAALSGGRVSVIREAYRDGRCRRRGRRARRRPHAAASRRRRSVRRC